MEWGRGPLTVDLNARYYASYRVTLADPARSATQLILDQGAKRVPAQVYVDLNVLRRFTASFGTGAPRTLEARLSIQNLFDRSPPIEVSISKLGFSPYGDPRRRWITASLSARF